MKFRKKPVVIDAVQWRGGKHEILDSFCGRNWGRADAHDVAWSNPDTEQIVIWNSAENQWLQVPVGHWVIRGLQGELYSCKPDIFEATYEAVESSPTTPARRLEQ